MKRFAGRLAGFGLAACLPMAGWAQAPAPAVQDTTVSGVTVRIRRATEVEGVTVTRCTAYAQTPDPAATPPVIVATAPAQGATAPSGWTPLSLTFDQPMSNCSFAYSPDFPLSFPRLSGQPPVIRDGRTLVLMVYLKPGETYGLKLNDAEHPFFIGRSGLAARPMELRFSTAR
jgi:hypothetical protein